MSSDKAIIFDFGNVLCSFDNKVFLKALSRRSLCSVPELDRVIYKESRICSQYETGEMSSEEFMKNIQALAGTSLSEEEFIEHYARRKFSPIPGSFELVQNLKDQGYKLGLLSNTSEMDFEHYIRKIPVFPLFDAVSTSYQVGAMKPSPLIYKDSLAKLELPAQSCVYIDDVTKYVQVAQDMGMRGIVCRENGQVVQDLRALDIKI
jgi:glucose-1-phosphatase